MDKNVIVGLAKLGVGIVSGLAAGYFMDGIVSREVSKDSSKGIRKAIVGLGAAATSLAVSNFVGDSCSSMVDDIMESINTYKEMKALQEGTDDGNA